MKKAMEPLVKLMKKTDKVRIKAPGTDLTLSIKGIGAQPCFGDRNIPDGEVYSAPVKNSINGVVQFNTDTTYNGEFFSNIRLEFKDGKIVKAKSLAMTPFSENFGFGCRGPLYGRVCAGG